MAHKLQIYITRSVNSELLSSFAKVPDEYVRGEMYTLTLVVKNVSSSPFPGGKITNCYAEYPGIPGLITSLLKFQDKAVPHLNAGEQQELGTNKWVGRNEGPGWFRVQVEAVDGQPVEYYRKVGEEPRRLEGDAWYDYFYIIDRESALIALELRELKGLLTKQKGSFE